MPFYKDNMNFGHLIVVFDILFPVANSITDEDAKALA